MPERGRGNWKALVRSRARGCCEYCRSQERFATESFSLEHIVPLGSGGMDDIENLALACQGCNNHKYIKTEGVDPVTGTAVALFHPRLQKWRDHFIWSHDFTLVLGLTSTGRATVEALRLNREGLVNLRRALFQIGEHPPRQDNENP
jgi:HNH endonuclease